MEEPLSDVLARYDLVPPVELFPLANSGINNWTLGVRTGAGEFVWKAYMGSIDPASIEYEHRLLAWLDAVVLSFRVAVPLPAHSGATVIFTQRGRHALFNKLPGVRPETRNLDHVEAIGAALGELHAALFHFAPAAQPDGPCFGDLHRIHPRVPDPFNLTPEHLGLSDAAPHATLLSWWRDELTALRPFVDGAYRALPWQVIHGDFLAANTLFHDGRLSAVLDFEFAHPDARALDVASGLKFSMRVWEITEPWEIARSFCRGYGRWIRLTGAEVEAVPWLIRLRDATSVVWWIGRGLTMGDIGPGLERMQSSAQSTQWLEEHGRCLVDVVGQEAGR